MRQASAAAPAPETTGLKFAIVGLVSMLTVLVDVLAVGLRAPALAGLPAGRYQLAVEVAREHGGRELVRVPFEWGGAANAAQAQGEKELGQVTVNVEP